MLELSVKSIDSNKILIKLEQSKGTKDRYVMLSEKLLSLLRWYYREYRPKDYLFEGQSGGKYSHLAWYSQYLMKHLEKQILRKVLQSIH